MGNNKENLSEEEFKERRYLRRLLPAQQDMATLIGNFSTCRLPRCRRAKRCLGSHPPDEIGSTRWKRFPPCISDEDKFHDFAQGTEHAVREWDRRMLAAGYDAASLKKEVDEQHRAMREDDDWEERNL
ncbi:MAG: hypothetical protein QHC90_14365 [Shinella sp.]|nr:hypothetical protein [Shinella sp.]